MIRRFGCQKTGGKEMKGRRWTIVVLILCMLRAICAGACSPEDTVSGVSRTVMFWNIENFFDPFDDSLAADEEFLPTGAKRWTWKKFLVKRNAVSKAILSVKDMTGSFPGLVGFAEVENYMVLSQLVRNTALSKLDYGIIHRDSPDRRGIDVALLYRKDSFVPVKVGTLPVITGGRPTRDILHVTGFFIPDKGQPDTVEVFVAHFPSKFGGERLTARYRMEAAMVLSTKINKVLENRKRNIIVMGDFNDTPNAESLCYLTDYSGLVNLGAMRDRLGRADSTEAAPGTIKYKGKWELIDNFLVNFPAEMLIYNHPALREEDGTYMGIKPFRTYYGPIWHGGVSDHFPILLKIKR